MLQILREVLSFMEEENEFIKLKGILTVARNKRYNQLHEEVTNLINEQQLCQYQEQSSFNRNIKNENDNLAICADQEAFPCEKSETASSINTENLQTEQQRNCKLESSAHPLTDRQTDECENVETVIAEQCYEDFVIERFGSDFQTEEMNESDVKMEVVVDHDERFCRICCKQFESEMGLMVHNQTKHAMVQRQSVRADWQTNNSAVGSTENLLCPICDKNFTQQSTLEKHIKMHFSNKEFECDLCHSKFTTKSNLSIHKRNTHSDARPYKCDVCDKTFKYTNSRNMHLRNVHKVVPKKHMRLSLPQNTKKHEITIKTFNCTFCKKTFFQSRDLEIHIRKHTRVKPFICNICQTAFSQKSNLTVHIRIHTNEMPYSCDVCNVKFRHVNALKKHKRKCLKVL